MTEAPKPSASFFANTACPYYPCHKTTAAINCLFCYCPLYFLDDCPGHCTWLSTGDGVVKDCSGCVFPHVPENYEKVLECLRKHSVRKG